MEIYLDNAATSHPKPDSVIQAVTRALTSHNANPGRSGHRRALQAGRALMDCRSALAMCLGAPDPLNISFAHNCTDALNLAIKGTLSTGDHVITTALEHNSVLRPLMTLKARGVIDVTLIEPDGDGFIQPQTIKDGIRKNTKLVAVTQASNVLGTVQPVAAIGEVTAAHGISFLIDGAQALGLFPVNVQSLACDLYAFPGHKGLLGPQGTGGLYIREGLPVTPIREGGTGSSSDSMIQPEERPDCYESGTVNFHSIAGLHAGVEYIRDNALTLRAHERALTEQLMKGLTAFSQAKVYASSDARNRVGVVSFNLMDYASGAVADALNRRGFAVRGGLHCAPGAHTWLGTLTRGAVRVSVGYKNTSQEIEAFLRAVQEITRGGL